MAWKLLFPLFIVAILVTFHQVDGTLRDILSQSRSRFINKRALTDFALCHKWNYWNDPCCRSHLACFRDRIRDRIRDRRQDDNDLADWTYLWCWIQKEKLNCTTTFNWTVDSIEQILLFWVFEMSFDKYWVVFLSIKIILKRIRFYMFYE